MIEIKFIELLILKIILLNEIKNTIQEEICSINTTCENCIKCEIKENENNSCEYGNLFCKKSNSFLFFSELKSSYIDYFSKNKEAQNICGNINIILKEGDSYKIIKIGEQNQNYLINNPLHCIYNFKNYFNNDYDIYISFLLSSKNNINNSNLSLFLYFNSEKFFNYYYSDIDLRNSEKIIRLSGINDFSIMLDINKLNINDSEFKLYENLIINIYADLKHSFNNKNPKPPNKEKDSSKRKKYKIYYIISGSLIGLLILSIMIVKNCLKRKFYRNRNTERNNLNRGERIDYQRQIENRKKIEMLFNTKLYPLKFTKKMLEYKNTSCSICLENFIEEKSIISLTPCEHIFHYQCLKKWAEENNEQFKCPNCNHDFMKDNEPITIKIAKRDVKHNNIHSNHNNLTNRINNNNIDTLRSINNMRSINNNNDDD